MKNTQNKQLSLKEIVDIAKGLAQDVDAYVSLSSEDQARLTIGTSFSRGIARCRAYIPGEKPELGLVISVWDIDRQSGNAALVSEENE